MAGKDDQAALEAFVADLGVDAFPHTVDADGDLWSTFSISSQPAFVFINDDGTITTNQGAMGAEALTDAVENLIAS